MKKSLMSLLLVGSLLTPSALVLAETTGLDSNDGLTTLNDSADNGDVGSDVETVKQEALAIINTLNLSEERKAAFRGSINARNTVAEIQEWLGYAQAEAAENDAANPNLTEPRPESWDDERLTITSFEDTSAIAFETERVANADMFEDEDEVIITHGVDGVLTITSQIAQWNGNAASWLPGGGVRELTKVTTEPITQVVEYGTAVRGQEKDTTRIDIPFETKVVENDELPIGTEEVSQEGVDGWYELTTIYETKDGVRTEKVLKEEEETDRKEPVNKIIQKGTKEVADEFVVTATLTDEEGNALAGEVLTITGEDVEQKLTTNENGAVTFSVPNGTYTVSFGDVSASVTIEDKDASVELVGVVENKKVTREDLLGRGDDLITFETEEDAQAAIDALDEEEQEGLEVRETDDGLFYVVHVIPVTPIEPAQPIEKDTDEGSEVVDVVTDDDQAVRVVHTDSRSELPETGELGTVGVTLAGMLSALGGIGLLFRKRK